MSSDNTTAPVVVGLVIVVMATLAVTALLLPMDDPEPIPPVDTPASTAFVVTNLPPPLTQEVAVTVAAARGPAIQLSEPPPAPPTTTIPIPPHYSTWLKLAQCESGGDWSINTGNGFYGGLQFTLTSWRGAGGWQFAKYPHHATPLDQMWIAEVLLMYQGWNAWPGCSRKLGLR